MGKFEDLTGQKFGRLKVIKQLPSAITPKGQKVRIWECECECGTIVPIRGGHLKSGHTISCGCYLEEHKYKIKVKNIIGEKFGRLTIVKYLGSSFWECLCDCGNITRVHTGSLDGHTRSCGCLSNEKRMERNKKRLDNLEGKKYGMLEVIKISHIDSVRGACWVCKCDCGNEAVVHASNLKKGSVKSCGCLSESFLASELKKYFTKKYSAEKEKKLFKNPDTNQWLRCDIYIPHGKNPDLNGFYIEVHGSQHYVNNGFFFKTKEDFEKRKHLDKIKKKFAKKNGVYIEIDLRKINTLEDAIEYVEKDMEKTLSKNR